jgi:LysR family nitrogen assimilation transcriptional regulator
MDLKALKYLSEACRLGSITKASTLLNVAQPALSRQIRLLEEELGVVLLLRHRRGVRPTKEGLHFVRSADDLLRMAQRIRNELVATAAEPSGVIRLGFLPGPGGLLVGKLIAQFIRQFPKVTFELRESLTADLSEALITDKLDLAIMIYEAKHQDLCRKPLFAEDLWLAAAPSIWPFRKKTLQIRELEGLPLVHAAIVGKELEKLASRHKVQLHTVIAGDTRSAARVAVREGAGFMLMPASSVADELSRGGLVGAPVKGLTISRGLFWRADHALSSAAVEFIVRLDAAVASLKEKKCAGIRPIAATE